MTEETKDITANIRFVIRNQGDHYRTMRNAVQALTVAWTSETLLSPPSKTGEMFVEIKLVAKDRNKLQAAHEVLKGYATVQSFDLNQDSTSYAGRPSARVRKRSGAPALRR